MIYKELSANTVAFINCRHRLHLQLMKATVLIESFLYFIFSLGYLCYCYVYRCESGRCCTFSFFLKFFDHFTFLGFPFILPFKITTCSIIGKVVPVLNFGAAAATAASISIPDMS